MKKILVFALLLLAFNAQSQTKYETEKWLEEKLYAFSGNSPYLHTFVKKVEVHNCEILVSIVVQETSSKQSLGYETIPISSLLSYAKYYNGVEDVYRFRGNIKWTLPSVELNESNSIFFLINVPDEMLERIQKALEHYRKLCGVNEPF